MKDRAKRVPASERRKQILKVAQRIFSRQGFRGTTTRQIADRAGVNEAIVFRYFKSKEDLYWSVLDDMCRAAPGRQELEAIAAAHPGGKSTGAEEEKVFAVIAEGILKRSKKDNGLGRLLFFSALERHSLSARFFKTYVASYCEALAAYINSRIETGVFRRLDALLAARGFVGMVYYHHVMQELFGAAKYQKFDDTKTARELASLWVRGVVTTPFPANAK